jgi:DNA-binding response OmpR family regulator
MRLLLVEDVGELASLIEDFLSQEGFAVDHAECIEDAAAAADTAAYNALVVDRMLPDGDGVNFVRSLRRQGNNTPAVIISAMDEVEHRVSGLNAGADDYLAKPLSLDELVARLRAVLRRPTNALDSVIEANGLAMDMSTRQVWFHGKEIRLPRRELGLLEVFMRRLGKIVPREALQDQLYSFNEDVSPNALEVGVYRLRNHLANAGSDLALRTVRGVGYVLTDESPEK